MTPTTIAAPDSSPQACPSAADAIKVALASSNVHASGAIYRQLAAAIPMTAQDLCAPDSLWSTVVASTDGVPAATAARFVLGRRGHAESYLRALLAPLPCSRATVTAMAAGSVSPVHGADRARLLAASRRNLSATGFSAGRSDELALPVLYLALRLWAHSLQQVGHAPCWQLHAVVQQSSVAVQLGRTAPEPAAA